MRILWVTFMITMKKQGWPSMTGRFPIQKVLNGDVNDQTKVLVFKVRAVTRLFN